MPFRFVERFQGSLKGTSGEQREALQELRDMQIEAYLDTVVATNAPTVYLPIITDRYEQSGSVAVGTVAVVVATSPVLSLLAGDVVMLDGSVDFNITVIGAATATGQLRVNAGTITSATNGSADMSRVADRKTAVVNARYVVPSDGDYTFDLTTIKTAALGTAATFGSNTGFLMQVLRPSNLQ